mmetsp:Transcript_76623/g.183575  ORF Transcript_76623/g.183575 Transcript_76623/m.183575 type:complete len:342 (-) Transcript_76623:1097-2122(-)
MELQLLVGFPMLFTAAAVPGICRTQSLILNKELQQVSEVHVAVRHFLAGVSERILVQQRWNRSFLHPFDCEVLPGPLQVQELVAFGIDEGSIPRGVLLAADDAPGLRRHLDVQSLLHVPSNLRIHLSHCRSFSDGQKDGHSEMVKGGPDRVGVGCLPVIEHSTKGRGRARGGLTLFAVESRHGVTRSRCAPTLFVGYMESRCIRNFAQEKVVLRPDTVHTSILLDELVDLLVPDFDQYAFGCLKSFTDFIGCCLDEFLDTGFFVDTNLDLLIAFDRVPHQQESERCLALLCRARQGQLRGQKRVKRHRHSSTLFLRTSHHRFEKADEEIIDSGAVALAIGS